MSDEGGGALREILAFFDIQIGQEQLEKGVAAIDKLKKQVKEFSEVALAGFAVDKLKEFVKETVEMGERIADTAKRLNISTDQLQEFQGMLELSGGSAEDAGMAFRFFNRAVLEAGKGGDAAAMFKKLGINIKDGDGKLISLTGSLGEIADGLEKIENPVERGEIKMKLFGRTAGKFNEMLEKGSEGVADLKKEVYEAGGVLDANFIQQAKIAGDEMKKVDMATRALKVTFITEFMPSIRNVVIHIRQGIMWFRDMAQHTDIVKEAMSALAAVGILKVSKALLELSRTFGLMKAGSEAGLIGQLFGLGEVGLIIAGLLVLYLIFDDLFNLFQGNESLIGDTLYTMLGYDKAQVIIENLKEAWSNLTDTIKDVGIDLPNMLTVLEDMVLAVTIIVEWWVVLEQTVAMVLNTIIAIGKALSTDLTSGHWAEDMKRQFADWDKTTDKNYDRITKAVDAMGDIAAKIPASWADNQPNRLSGNEPDLNVTINYMGKTIDPRYLSDAERDEWNGAVAEGTQQAIDKAYAHITSRKAKPGVVDTGANQ